MTPDLARLKAALRGEIRVKLAALTSAARAVASSELRGRLRATGTWKNAKSILLFAPLTDEPEVWPLAEAGLAANKILGLPRFASALSAYVAGQVCDLARDLVPGKFQIREPAASCPELPLAGFELVLVPGVAFDLRGRRLGRGRGFYDRLLAEIRGLKCGVAFDEQVVAEVPAADHDARMNVILTPTRWVKIEN
jgi:5-formyltetrahydrofolate cyclo-ligase